MTPNFPFIKDCHAQDEAPDVAFEPAKENATIRQMEEALRSANIQLEWYRSLYENSPVIYFTLNSADAKVLAANHNGASLLGYSVEELKCNSLFELVHAQDLAGLQSAFATWVQLPVAEGKWEFRLMRQDGSILWVRTSIQLNINDQFHENYHCLEQLCADCKLGLHLSKHQHHNAFATNIGSLRQVESDPLSSISNSQINLPTAIVLVCEDITASKQVEAGLAKDRQVEVAGIPITYENQPATQVVLHDMTGRKCSEAKKRT
ncbi:PAS domain-containing protein [Microcoleus sp. FACHB-672]|uniref:PAS domain-containing protein n=1 Tax=Microcoleus sp. FACHB-672 TaxID=2692825 RepID=UPI0016838816|nr:PAS domain-containing protein [Microcoleus sp. FACHB-672]MBD2041128.1 PAS domain S-box protein [Microcoleus sp. FACHB-672]